MIPAIQNSFISGELSPSFLGRTDKPQYRNGASTMRNAFVRYTGGSSSRAGFAYCGMCKQNAPNAGGTATSNPPRLINFQVNINQGFALEFGDQYMRILSQGAYIIEAPQNVNAITNANPGVFTIPSHSFSNGDWVFGSGIGGMTNFNALTWIVQNATTNTFTLTDLFGNVQNTTSFPAFTSGGTFARIYTVVSPYAAIDLQYLKFTENANTMNLACWNQLTNTEYPPYTLQRLGNTNWVFTQLSFTPAILPPASVTATANNSTTEATWYSYEVTSVDILGNESVASKEADVINNDISINAGSNVITWTSSGSNIASYNVYSATPVYTTSPNADPGFIGAPYGLIGSAFGQQFTDTNIIPDFTTSPPLHQNPFARGAITDVTATAGGTNWVQATTGFVINTSTGSGAILVPIVQGAEIVGGIVEYGGQGYAATDTATASGAGTGASISLVIGPQTGTYPGTVQYYQQRLVYANTINQPDTYFMSQTGLYNNFDAAIPTVDSDAITGTPWGVQINGIQFMVPSIQGLLAFTGNGVWLINGGNSIAITPSDQNAQAQSQVGCSAVVPPLFVNLHVLYVQAKNSIVRDIAFNFLTNVFTGTDITVFSNHLFQGYTLSQWAYAEEPFKTIWAVRNDGAMLSLCYVKEQEIQGWARHDTNGLYVSVCSVVEPPVDAVYTITNRYIPGSTAVPAGVWAYYSERMDNRTWLNIEDCFCVDAGLSYPLTYPNATLSPAFATGTDNITSTNLINGGTNYTNPQAVAVDSSGLGSGAIFSVTQIGGVLQTPIPLTIGQGYNAGTTSIIITDPTGSGAVVQPIITNYVTFNASGSVFNSGSVGQVIRVDGGKATIISQTGTACIANITQELTQTIPDDPNFLPAPAIAGTWSVATPITTVTRLNHLEGMQVTGLADGGVIVPVIVQNGSITLPTSASAINIGLPFISQIQTMYLETASQATVQGRRKDIQAITPRLESSRGVQVGTNQPDQSAQPNQATVPWTNMKELKERNNLITAGTAIPLFTGDPEPIRVPGGWVSNGQMAVQQIYPLPLNLLAAICWYSEGDNPS